MKNPGENIKRSILKRQAAMRRFQAKKEAYLLAREQISWEIQEARNIWITLEEQLPDRELKF